MSIFNLYYLYSNWKKKKGAMFDKTLCKKNARFRNQYKGARCFIVGNGPSIKSVDFSLLEKEYVFTVNQISKNPNYPKLKSNFHFVADKRFFDIDPTRPGDLELIQSLKLLRTEDNNPECFFEIHAKPMIERYGLNSILNINYFASSHLHLNTFFASHSYDLTRICPDFSTVVQTCICSAIYMGFGQIVLLGCDCTSVLNIINSRINKGVSDYGYAVSDGEQKRLKDLAKKTTIGDELIWQGQMFKDYDFLNSYCDEQGIELLNATESTILDSVKKVKLKDILNERVGE